MAIPYLACMALVARVYALPPRVLPSIQAVEGGTVGTVHGNTDGSSDYGVMQINSRWIAGLARVAHMQPDAVRERLVTDPCFNIAAAGVILRSYLNEAGGDLLRAVGYYHSHTRSIGEPYRLRVVSAAARLFVEPAAAVTQTVTQPAGPPRPVAADTAYVYPRQPAESRPVAASAPAHRPARAVRKVLRLSRR